MPNFCPDTGGRWWSLVQVASSVALRGGGALLSQPTLLTLPAALYGACPAIACGSSFRVLHKSAHSAAPAFCAFPAPAAQAARSLMGALPGAARLRPSVAPALVFRPCWSGACALCLALTLPADVYHPESQEVSG